MLCLEVAANGKHICVAGGHGIVSADPMIGTHIGEPPRPGVELAVIGATAVGIVEWARVALFEGESVAIKVVESATSDVPTRILTEPEFEGLADNRGVMGARSMYAALKARLRVLEAEWGEHLRKDA